MKKQSHQTIYEVRHRILLTLTISFLFMLWALVRPNYGALADDTQPTVETNLTTTTLPSSTSAQPATSTKALTTTPTVVASFTISPTAITTPTATFTTATPTPHTEAISPSFTIIRWLSFIAIGIVTLLVLGIIILNTRTQHVELRPRLSPKGVIEDRPRPIYKPIANSEAQTNEIQIELNSKLMAGLKVLRELYSIASKTQNDPFVSISDLELLLRERYPGKKIDLLRVAIEIANTQDGILKIQQAREDIYLIQVL
ncbi:MAG: hypothetical protein IT313_08785 [Anaerolineales bacterium]|nr:hypothetical protein [Anaerolineales bacterium]